MAVGKREEVEGNFPDYQRYDAKGVIILPGLVDCHVHMSQALIRGCLDPGDDRGRGQCFVGL